ncbi:MAG: hypothetical protein LBU00_03130 [Treponema sp.]|nr:hypothetical protein [Treponema sp.]
MNEEGARRLELLNPLLYHGRADLLPFPRVAEAPGAEEPGKTEWGERLFCFAIDEAQSRRIDPEPGAFLGPLLAAGYLEAADGGEGTAFGGETVELPRGRYLFAQKREALDKEAVIDLAIEVQKDGLWERLRLEASVYLRYLYEDGAAVTQVFRPYRV